MTLGQATRVVQQLVQSELQRGRRLVTAALLFWLPTAAAIVLAAFGRWGGGVFDQLLELDLAFLVPFLPAALLGSAVSDELDRGTAGFLFVRPAPRAALLTGRLAAVLPIVLGSAALSMAVGFVALYARFPGDIPRALPHFGASCVAVLGGLVMYSMMAIGIGASLRKRPVATLLAIFAVDAGLARAPIAVKLLAPAHHLRALAGLPDSGTLGPSWEIPLVGSALYLAVVLALALAYGVHRVRRLEMTGDVA